MWLRFFFSYPSSSTPSISSDGSTPSAFANLSSVFNVTLGVGSRNILCMPLISIPVNFASLLWLIPLLCAISFTLSRIISHMLISLFIRRCYTAPVGMSIDGIYAYLVQMCMGISTHGHRYQHITFDLWFLVGYTDDSGHGYLLSNLATSPPSPCKVAFLY